MTHSGRFGRIEFRRKAPTILAATPRMAPARAPNVLLIMTDEGLPGRKPTLGTPDPPQRRLKFGRRKVAVARPVVAAHCK